MKESFKQNIKNVGVGIAATVASVGIPKDAVAQHGLLGRIKDKIKDKIEMVEHKQQPAEVQQEVKKDSIIYNWGGDKNGFKYPFNKEYKSDENYYRTVAYANMKGSGMTSGELLQFYEQEAEMQAQFNVLKKEMNIEGDIKIYQENNGEPQIRVGDKKIHLGYIKIIDKATFKNTETGVYTIVIAIEILKNGIKIEKAEPSTEIQKNSNEKSVENPSKDWQEYKVEKPTPPPIGNKPKDQPVYNPNGSEKSDYHATFEDFQKSQKSDLDAFEKAKEEEFNKFKEVK